MSLFPLSHSLPLYKEGISILVKHERYQGYQAKPNSIREKASRQVLLLYQRTTDVTWKRMYGRAAFSLFLI